MTMAPVRIGALEDKATRSSASYLDFVSSLRQYSMKNIRPELEQVYEVAAGEFERRNGRPAQSLEDAQQMLGHLDLARWWKRLGRTTQEMNWQGSLANLGPYRQELEGALAEAAGAGPGRLVLDPELEYPEYFDAHEFHIQPGSYHGSPVAGYVYHFGIQVFHSGSAASPYVERPKMVNAVPVPADGVVDRVLDLACSIGICTEAWKRRFPEAEVWGIDIAAPMVSFAHLRAIEAGLDVNYGQMAAESLKFPDDHFDVVFVNILFHELPLDVAAQVIKEARRVLRPGGVFTVVDFGDAKNWNALDAYIRDFDSRDNGEPYAWDFCHWNIGERMTEAGFRNVQEARLRSVVSQRWGEK